MLKEKRLNLGQSFSELHTPEQSKPNFLVAIFFFFPKSYQIERSFWRKINAAPVCFGTKDDRFGRFKVQVGGSIEDVKLVHLYGWSTCSTTALRWTRWGCAGRPRYIYILITNSSNDILLPVAGNTTYKIPGYNCNSSEIVLDGFPKPISLSSDQELRLWHHEDYSNDGREYNNGKSTSCTDVFVKYL